MLENNFKKLMVEKNLTVEQVSFKTHISESTLKEYMLGKKLEVMTFMF